MSGRTLVLIAKNRHIQTNAFFYCIFRQSFQRRKKQVSYICFTFVLQGFSISNFVPVQRFLKVNKNIISPSCLAGIYKNKKNTTVLRYNVSTLFSEASFLLWPIFLNI